MVAKYPHLFDILLRFVGAKKSNPPEDKTAINDSDLQRSKPQMVYF